MNVETKEKCAVWHEQHALAFDGDADWQIVLRKMHQQIAARLRQEVRREREQVQ